MATVTLPSQWKSTPFCDENCGPIAPAFAVFARAGRASLDSRVRILSGQPGIPFFPECLRSRGKVRHLRGLGGGIRSLFRAELALSRFLAQFQGPVPAAHFGISGRLSSREAETLSFGRPESGRVRPSPHSVLVATLLLQPLPLVMGSAEHEACCSQAPTRRATVGICSTPNRPAPRCENQADAAPHRMGDPDNVTEKTDAA